MSILNAGKNFVHGGERQLHLFKRTPGEVANKVRADAKGAASAARAKVQKPAAPAPTHHPGQMQMNLGAASKPQPVHTAAPAAEAHVGRITTAVNAVKAHPYHAGAAAGGVAAAAGGAGYVHHRRQMQAGSAGIASYHAVRGRGARRHSFSYPDQRY